MPAAPVHRRAWFRTSFSALGKAASGAARLVLELHKLKGGRPVFEIVIQRGSQRLLGQADWSLLLIHLRIPVAQNRVVGLVALSLPILRQPGIFIGKVWPVTEVKLEG